MPFHTSAAHVPIAGEEPVLPGAFTYENGRIAPAPETYANYSDDTDYVPTGTTPNTAMNIGDRNLVPVNPVDENPNLPLAEPRDTPRRRSWYATKRDILTLAVCLSGVVFFIVGGMACLAAQNPTDPDDPVDQHINHILSLLPD